MTPEELTDVQLTAFSTIERVCSTLSLAGCAFIAITFLGSKHFHKPINRLVFYASMGNIFTNVATLISRSALHNAAGSLCQFQAFLIQMFMPADAYWTLAMACNVYLTFYHKFDGPRLRRLELYYMISCYGFPFIPAFVYIFAKSEKKGHIYGNATLWCWIDSKWDYLRIATFYGPVWVVMILTNAIYLRAGRDIYAKRKSLRNFRAPPPEPLTIIGDPFQSVKTTEVFVTSERADLSQTDSVDLHKPGHKGTSFPKPPQPTKNAYTVTVSTSQKAAQFQPSPQPGPIRYSYAEKPLDGRDLGPVSMESPPPPRSAHMPNSERSNLYPTRRHAAKQADNAAWSYTKVAILFMIAMMVTWVPSSANRVYSVVNPGKISLALEYASAFVLPLQGFWNALIYAVTSFKACELFWRDLTHKRRRRSGLKQMNIFAENREHSRNHKMYVETDSMTELATSPST